MRFLQSAASFIKPRATMPNYILSLLAHWPARFIPRRGTQPNLVTLLTSAPRLNKYTCNRQTKERNQAGLGGSPMLPLPPLPPLPVLRLLSCMPNRLVYKGRREMPMPMGERGSSSLGWVKPLTSLSMLELRPRDLEPRSSKEVMGGDCQAAIPGGARERDVDEWLSPFTAPQ